MPRPPVKSVTVRFRAFPKELAAWKRFARANATTLSNLMRDSMNALVKTGREAPAVEERRTTP